MMARQSQDRRGRVVLRMRGGAANPIVVKAAMRLARAFQGELHGLFVEDEDLLSLAAMPFAREISFTGRRSRPLSTELVREEMRAASEAMEREFDRLAQAAQVPARFEICREGATEALRAAMKESGILAIGEPLALAGGSVLRGMMREYSGFAGLVLAGSEARRAEGAIVAIIDAESDVALLVDTAEMLAKPGGEEVVLVLASEAGSESRALEDQARAALDRETRYRFERLDRITPQAVRGLVRRADGGMVVARLGGVLAHDEAGAARTACALQCPLLLLSTDGV